MKTAMHGAQFLPACRHGSSSCSYNVAIPCGNCRGRVRIRRLRRVRPNIDTELSGNHIASEGDALPTYDGHGPARVRDETSLVVTEDELAGEDECL